MLARTFRNLLLAAAGLLASSGVARAGGVIIDGRVGAAIDSAATAGDDTSQDDPDGGREVQTLAGDDTAQQLYLLTAWSFNVYDPNAQPDDDTTTTTTTTTTMQIIDDLDGEPAGGCNQAPVSLYAILLGLPMLLWRRRKQQAVRALR